MATEAQIKLAQQARKKARAQRTQQEIQAIRAVRATSARPARPSFGGGGYGLPPELAALLAPMSQEDMSAQIGSMVSSQVGPEQAMLQAEAQRLAGQTSAQSNQVSGLYQGLGQMLQPIAGSIEQTYQTAAQSQGAFGKGFSAGLEMLANQQGGQDAAFLQQQGAPQGQIEGVQNVGQGAGDVLYGLGGYLPATTLNREGAAMTSYAQTLPAVAARAGQQEIARINEEAGAAQAEISSRMQALAAQLPGMRAEAAQQLWAQELEKAKTAWSIIESNRKYQLDVQAMKLSAKIAGSDVSNQEWDNLLAAGYNPMTGEAMPVEPPSGTGKVNVAASEQAGIWMDSYGNAMLDANGNVRPWKAKKPTKAASKRPAYLEEIGKGIDSAYKTVFSQINRGGTTASGEPNLNAPPGSADTAPSGPTTPTYAQAYKAIYAYLHTTYGTGPGKWKHGVKDRVIRRRIREYLAGLSIYPPKPLTSVGGPGGGTLPYSSGSPGSGVGSAPRRF